MSEITKDLFDCLLAEARATYPNLVLDFEPGENPNSLMAIHRAVALATREVHDSVRAKESADLEQSKIDTEASHTAEYDRRTQEGIDATVSRAKEEEAASLPARKELARQELLSVVDPDGYRKELAKEQVEKNYLRLKGHLELLGSEAPEGALNRLDKLRVQDLMALEG